MAYRNKNLTTEFTLEEIADAFMLPQRLTKKQKVQADVELTEARKKVQAELTDEDRLTARLLQFKLHLEDYLKSEKFLPTHTFGGFLREYIDLLDKDRKVFAKEINISEAELSQLINHHRTPPEHIIVRLEIHSNNIIPAEKWFWLVEKERAHTLKTNKKLRKQQQAHVTRKLKVKL